ncbi:MAG TPA: glutathione peroxidase, partial [Gammaproteobacteria bacterium]|nr:glutathione peroxidase [Gammaproteobacteria bacterium]
RWNFHKYLLDRNGRVVGSYGSLVRPDNKGLLSKIESLL